MLAVEAGSAHCALALAVEVTPTAIWHLRLRTGRRRRRRRRRDEAAVTKSNNLHRKTPLLLSHQRRRMQSTFGSRIVNAEISKWVEITMFLENQQRRFGGGIAAGCQQLLGGHGWTTAGISEFCERRGLKKIVRERFFRAA